MKIEGFREALRKEKDHKRESFPGFTEPELTAACAIPALLEIIGGIALQERAGSKVDGSVYGEIKRRMEVVQKTVRKMGIVDELPSCDKAWKKDALGGRV